MEDAGGWLIIRGANAKENGGICGVFPKWVDMAVIFWVLLRMDNTNYLLRGWRESLAGDNAMSGEQAQAYSLVIEKYLLAGEKRGWVVGGSKDDIQD